MSVHGTDFHSICHTHPPPSRPRRNPKCAVLETRKAHFAFRPREAARCCHVGHAARIAMPSALQAGQPVHRVIMSPLFGTPKAEPSNACPVSCPRQQRGGEHSRSYSKTSITASQRIWMSRHIVPGTNRPLDSPSPHELSPEDNPGLSAPMWKARSQKPDVCPRKLCQPSGLSLRATRLAAASRLSRSCHRPRGPVAHPRSGWPARRSRHPAALWSGRCLTLRIHSRANSSKVCATRTSFIAPLDLFAPQGAGPLVLQRRGGARGGAPAKQGRGSFPGPLLLRARSLPPPQSAASVIAQVWPLFRVLTVTQGGRRPRAPLSASRPSDVRAAQACPHWGRPEGRRVAATSWLRGSLHSFPVPYVRASPYVTGKGERKLVL